MNINYHTHTLINQRGGVHISRAFGGALQLEYIQNCRAEYIEQRAGA